MATSIFSLFGEIFIDNQKANEGIDKTTQKGESMGKKLGGGFATVGKVAAGIGAAAVGAGAAMFGLAENAAGVADRVDKQSQALGLSMKGYQEWDYILAQNGASVDSLAKGMTNITGVIEGTNKKGSEAIKELGINIEGMNKEEVFNAVVAGLQGVESETEKARLANAVFGKAYQELTPLLNQTAEGTEELRENAHALGLVLEDDAVTAGVVFGDTLDDLKKGFGALVTQLGTSLFPILTELMGHIIELLPVFRDITQKIVPILLELMEKLVPVFMTVVEKLLPPLLMVVEACIPLLSLLVEQILPPLLDVIVMLLPYLVEVINELMPMVVEILQIILPLIKPIIEMALPVLVDLLDLLIKPLLQLLKEIMPPLTEVIKFLAAAIMDNLKVAFDGIQPVIKAAMGILTGLIEFVKAVFTGDWAAAWEAVKKIFSNIWEGIQAAFKLPINFIISGINTFIEGINKIKIPDWVPGVGGKGFSIGKIPMLAEGGIITKPGSFMVGEAGPEILTANAPGAEVRPLDKLEGGGDTFQINISIDKFNGQSREDVEHLADRISDVLENRLQRKREAFGGGTRLLPA
jgi:hypothetical protein